MSTLRKMIQSAAVFAVFFVLPNEIFLFVGSEEVNAPTVHLAVHPMSYELLSTSARDVHSPTEVFVVFELTLVAVALGMYPVALPVFLRLVILTGVRCTGGKAERFDL